MKISFLTICLLAITLPLSAWAATVSVIPSHIFQGDPVMITVSGTSTEAIQSATAESSKLSFMAYNATPTALYGVGLNQKIGRATVSVIFRDGSQTRVSFTVDPRSEPQEFLPVPAQLGGNSAQNQQIVLSALTTDNASLASIYSNTHISIWSEPGVGGFTFPIASTTKSPLTVTDPYGYMRNSGVMSVPHKGVDFRAPPGTPVYAISRGIVRMTKNYVVYGNTIVLDHGLGLMSMYMHLSRMMVKPGQLVQKGDLIGFSGETGFTEGPHLHLTIRIGSVSIDPMKFFTLFGVR